MGLKFSDSSLLPKYQESQAYENEWDPMCTD